MGSHSVTCHPTQMSTPRLNPSHTARYSSRLHIEVTIKKVIFPRTGPTGHMLQRTLLVSTLLSTSGLLGALVGFHRFHVTMEAFIQSLTEQTKATTGDRSATIRSGLLGRVGGVRTNASARQSKHRSHVVLMNQNIDNETVKKSDDDEMRRQESIRSP